MPAAASHNPGWRCLLRPAYTCRCVIMVGLPYPNPSDPELQVRQGRRARPARWLLAPCPALSPHHATGASVPARSRRRFQSFLCWRGARRSLLFRATCRSACASWTAPQPQQQPHRQPRQPPRQACSAPTAPSPARSAHSRTAQQHQSQHRHQDQERLSGHSWQLPGASLRGSQWCSRRSSSSSIGSLCCRWRRRRGGSTTQTCA